MSLICLLVLVVANSVLARNVKMYDVDDASNYFETFRRTYNKEYDEIEKALRYKIFVENLKQINHFNEISDGSFYGINQFSDLTSEEFIQKYTGFIISNQTANYRRSDETEGNYWAGDAPDSFDWRDKGVVTDVQNQKDCNSCWAFSIIGNLESAYAIKTQQIVGLSEQQLVDCDSDSNGCSGGFPINACEYLRQNGAMSRDSYPYEDKQGTCRYNSNSVQVKAGSCMSIQVSEEELESKLVNIGPLTIGIDSAKIQTYTNGIVRNEMCHGSQANHAVLLVGYGTDESGMKYWLVKNSWGATWGEQGFFRIQRGVNCIQILDTPAVAVVVN